MVKKTNNPFMPNGYLETINSLNRLNNFVNFLSSDVLIEKVKNNKFELGITADLHESQYVRLLSEIALETNNPNNIIAKSIIEDWVMSLCNFFKLLLTADLEQRKIHPIWSDEHWEFWNNRNTIIIGGGLTLGYMGGGINKIIVPYIKSLGKKIIIPKWRKELPIIGAALAIPGITEGYILGFDFGHSSIKISMFSVNNTMIISSFDLPEVIVPRQKTMMSNDFETNPKEFQLFFYNTLSDNIKKYKNRFKIEGIGISIANYIQNGVVVKRGLYGNLDGNIKNHIQDILEENNISKNNLSILHDGTAAANCYYNQDNPAILIFGSAIGGGFPYEKPPLSWSDESYIKLPSLP